ncbi:hypothetical protein KQX54_018643 [Cotesia glomerata]|uniref:Uncharacterized protein n=1 Tax=Cotesia glomerata TaxID=32391 RepID=A0AAV7HVI5_COTGL|nr:hypothetical protein KQX54_018643 [Cotesia glomerata]
MVVESLERESKGVPTGIKGDELAVHLQIYERRDSEGGKDYESVARRGSRTKETVNLSALTPPPENLYMCMYSVQTERSKMVKKPRS